MLQGRAIASPMCRGIFRQDNGITGERERRAMALIRNRNVAAQVVSGHGWQMTEILIIDSQALGVIRFNASVSL